MKKQILIAMFAVCMALTACAQPKQESQPTPNQEQQTAGKVNVMTQAQFKEQIYDLDSKEAPTLKSELPVVVDFNATWCGPCRRLAPILEELAKKYEGKIQFYSIDVDQNKELAQKLQIQSIPMLLMCPTKGNPQTIVGLVPQEDLVKAFDQVLLGIEPQQ